MKEQFNWTGCGDCDLIFSCHNGRTACARVHSGGGCYMTTHETLLRQALDALEPVSAYGRVGTKDVEQTALQRTCDAIRAHLEQPQAEPVAHLWKTPQGDLNVWVGDPAWAGSKVFPVYAAPQAQQAAFVRETRHLEEQPDGTVIPVDPADMCEPQAQPAPAPVVPPSTMCIGLHEALIDLVRAHGIIVAPSAPAPQQWPSR